MPESTIGLRLGVALAPDADAAELEHGRALAAAALGPLIVGAGRGAIGRALTAGQSWVARRSSRSVKIPIDGDARELTNASREDRRRPVESPLARHSP